MMVTLSSNAIGNFISYSGNSVSEFSLTYRGELIDEYIDEYSASGQGRFALNLPTPRRFYTKH
jgi:hypothetical protein